MQAKDLQDKYFLLAVRYIGERKGYWVNRIELATFLNVPHRIVLAKARKLIRRELLDGCSCGCRGDFEVTSKGMKLLMGVKDEVRSAS